MVTPLSRPRYGHSLSARAREFAICAADGYELKARLWTMEPSDRPLRIAVINAGAGISSRYYDRFAMYLAEQGCPTLVYDYRGIGQSRPVRLNGFAASVFDWGSKDCAGVLQWLLKHYPTAEKVVIGHSVGGFLTGFAANGHLINRMLLIGAHTGYYGDYAAKAKMGMYVLWHVFMPLITRVFGYFPGRKLHLLEDLPAGVALQWANRRKPDFWWNICLPDGNPDVARIVNLISHFRAIRGVGLAISFKDDPFATADATARILSLYSNCLTRVVHLCPNDVQGQKIGHFGFFRSRFKDSLWPIASEWLIEMDK